jgi:hypothetical protein
MDAEVVAIVLLGSFGDVAPVEVCQPEVAEVPERARDSEVSSSAVPGPFHEPDLEVLGGPAARGGGGLDVAQDAVEVAESGTGSESPGLQTRDVDGAVGSDGGARTAGSHRAPLAWLFGGPGRPDWHAPGRQRAR